MENNNIDFSQLNLDYFFNLYMTYKNDIDIFKQQLSNSEKELKKYKTVMVSILFDYLSENNNHDMDISKFTEDELLKICLIPFITPLKNKKSTFGLKKDSNYITLDLTKIDDMEFIEHMLKLYTNPNNLFKYCIKTIKLFIKLFYKNLSDTKTTDTIRSDDNKYPEYCSKPILLYEYSNE